MADALYGVPVLRFAPVPTVGGTVDTGGPQPLELLIFRYCRDCSGYYNVVAVEPGSPLSIPSWEWPWLLFGSPPVQLPKPSPARLAL